MKRGVGLFLFGLSLGLAAPRRVLANGRFPQAEQIVVQPGSPQHVVARSTFGILPSSDGGATFDWICEAAVHYGNGLDPGIAMTGNGTIIAGVFGGISASKADACAFDLFVPNTFIADVTIDKSHPSTALAVGSKQSGGYFVWRSKDDAQHWTELSGLPDGFYPSTIDIAPSDASRLYTAGGYFQDGGSRSSLARSIDGGHTWEIVSLPPTPSEPEPFIAGIDPNDARTVWVRPDTEPGVLLLTRDGGDSWVTALTFQGEVLGFAISPDGTTVLAAGPKDGVWSASMTAPDAGPPVFSKINDLRATCLAWPDDRVFACADPLKSGFSIALSHDAGMSFAPLLQIACVRGPLSCPASSDVATQCDGDWPLIAMKIHHDDCSDAGTPSTSSSTGGAGPSASSGTGAGGNGPASSASASSGAGGGGGKKVGGGGCGCRTTASDPEIALLPGLGLLALALRRNRRRPRA